MKTFYCFLALLLTPGICTAWAKASSEQKRTVVVFSEDDFRQGQPHLTKDLTLARGQTLVVQLGSNPTTGFRWTEQVSNSNPEVLKQAKHNYSTSGSKGKDGEPMAGAGGTEEWTFEALKKGEATLSFSYDRPWQGGEKGTWTLKIKATVQ